MNTESVREEVGLEPSVQVGRPSSPSAEGPFRSADKPSPSKSSQVLKPEEQKPEDRFWWWALLGGALFFIFSLYQLNLDYARLVTGTGEFLQMFGRMFPPDFSEWRYILPAAVESLQVGTLGTVISIVFALLLAFLAAGNISPHPWFAAVVKGFAATLRVIPTIVWALIFIVAVGMGPLPGVMAIAVHSLGFLTKMFAQSIEELDEGIIEAMRATGASWLQIVCQGLIPSVATAFASWSILRLEIDIGESTILGLVGAGGIGWELSRAMRGYHFDQAFVIALVIFLMVYAVEIFSNRLRATINRVGV